VSFSTVAQTKKKSNFFHAKIGHRCIREILRDIKLEVIQRKIVLLQEMAQAKHLCPAPEITQNPQNVASAEKAEKVEGVKE